MGVPFPTVADLPSPAARFGCIPHVSGKNGGHDINLRQLARQGVHLYGHLESAAGTTVRFSDDLEQRLAFADSAFDVKFKPGYRLDFGWVDLPIFDEWGYPRHIRGVTTHPGLYVVGLPWLHSELSAAFAGVGADAAYIVKHIVRREQSGHGHRAATSSAEKVVGDFLDLSVHHDITGPL